MGIFTFGGGSFQNHALPLTAQPKPDNIGTLEQYVAPVTPPLPAIQRNVIGET